MIDFFFVKRVHGSNSIQLATCPALLYVDTVSSISREVVSLSESRRVTKNYPKSFFPVYACAAPPPLRLLISARVMSGGVQRNQIHSSIP